MVKKDLQPPGNVQTDVLGINYYLSDYHIHNLYSVKSILKHFSNIIVLILWLQF